MLMNDNCSPENFRSRVLELNASDERGISIVREKIKNFARQTPKRTPEDSQYPCPPYKIIILDEADSMTQDAQGALRRIMETHSKITRFCLVCNYVTRSVQIGLCTGRRYSELVYLSSIIDPLASRCSKFRFTPLDVGATRERLEHISLNERVTISPEAINALITTSEGDLRRSITYLQSASRLSTSTNPPTEITPWDIQEIAGVVPDEIINKFLTALGVDMPEANDNAMDVDDAPIKPRKVLGFDDVREEVRAVVRAGYSTAQVISQVRDLSRPLPNARTKPFERDRSTM